MLDDLPSQLHVLGRLRVIDLWHYVRDSIAVRDILILTVVSSEAKNDELFSKYFHTLRNGHRAAVMTKQLDSSTIRDLYVLPAETNACPTSIFSTFALPKTFDSNRLFLIVIGSTKRSVENETTNSFVYKPIALQDVTMPRDPRLSKLIDETFVVLRQATSIEAMQPTISSLLQTLRSRHREDLASKFTEDLRTMIVEWQTQNPSTVSGDNLVEENMDVDEEQPEEKPKEREPPRRERKRKSRFSDIVPPPNRFAFANSSFAKNQWLEPKVPRIPFRAEATVNLRIQQEKLHPRVASTNKEWKSTYTNYSAHYHDFDRPEE